MNGHVGTLPVVGAAGVALLMLVAIVNLAVGQPSGPPAQFALNPSATPFDTKRIVLEINSASVSGPHTAELSSNVGFAQQFSFGIAPYKVLLATNGNGSVFWDFVVKIDMNNDGTWDLNQQVAGPSSPSYDPSARVTAVWNYAEPAYPNTYTQVITWAVDVRRLPLSGGNPFIDGTVSSSNTVTILPTPHATYAEVAAATQEPSTLTGYLGLGVFPVVIVEGYDATNTTYPSEFFGDIFQRTNGVALIDELYWAGADVYMYNHGNASLSLRENALRLLGALTRLDADYSQPIRVLGFSLGGVVSRYALAWAEQYGYEHGCATFISADAPQQAAWLNLDFQLWLNDNLANPTMAALANLLMTPASKELLRMNVFDTMPSSFPDPTPTSQDFFAELNALNSNGYPHRTRNIALANGRGATQPKNIPSVGPPAWIGANRLVRFDVNGIGIHETKFERDDILGGSLQPAFRHTSITNHRVLWNGRLWLFRLTSPIALTFNIELGPYGSSSFIHVPSALDLYGVTRTGVALETVDGWTGSKFDEIYMDPSTGSWHDQFPGSLATIAVQKLLESEEVVAPAPALVHRKGNDLPIVWRWRSASSVDIAIAPDGQTFVNLIAGMTPTRCTPTDPSANGCWILQGSQLASVAPGSSFVIRVKHNYPGGAVVTRTSSSFTVWGVNESSVQCVPAFSCNSPTLQLQIRWDTNVATDGVDVVEIYKPGEIPGVHAPQVASAPSQGTHHVVNWYGSCQTGTWTYVVKSTKSASGTVASAVKVRQIAECASCPPPCNPPCELE